MITCPVCFDQEGLFLVEHLFQVGFGSGFEEAPRFGFTWLRCPCCLTRLKLPDGSMGFAEIRRLGEIQ